MFPTFHPSISLLSKNPLPSIFHSDNCPFSFSNHLSMFSFLFAFFHPSIFLFSIRPSMFHSSFDSQFFLNPYSFYPSFYPFITQSSLFQSVHPPSLHPSTWPFSPSPLPFHPFNCPFFLLSLPSILSSRHPRSIPGGSHLISREHPKEKRVLGEG